MVLVNYRDAVLYEEDVELLRGSNWLNEACINFAFRLLDADFEHVYPEHIRARIYLIDPSVVSWIRWQLDEDEIVDFVESSKLLDKDWIFLPINNARSLLESGSHWSLLAMDIRGRKGFAFDPMVYNNSKAAEATFIAMNKALDYYQQRKCGENELVQPTVFMHIPPNLVPQQTDSFNCGIYTILFVDFLAKKALREISSAKQDTPNAQEEGKIQGHGSTPAEELREFSGSKDTAWLEEMRRNIDRAACERFRRDVVVEIQEQVQAKTSKSAGARN